MATLTVNSSVITDAIASTVRRQIGTSGDGLSGPQLVTNTDFETNLTGWTAGANCTHTRVTSDHFSGSACNQLAMATSAGNRYDRATLANVDPSLSLVCTAYAKCTAGSYVSGTLQLLASDATTVLKSVAVTGSGDWQQWTMTATSSDLAGNTTCYLQFIDAADALARTWLLDLVTAQPPGDGSLYVGPAETNLLNNGGFESNLTDWFASGTETVTRDGTVSKFGTYSLKCVTGATGSAVYHYNSGNPVFTPGTPYVYSGWVLATTAVNCYLSADLYDSSVRRVQSDSGSTVTLAAGVWTQVSMSFTAALTAGQAVLYVNAAANVTFYLDGVQVAARTAGTALTRSGNEVIDDTRVIGIGGDARLAPDRTMGIWTAATNLFLRSNALNTAPNVAGGPTITENGTTDPYGGTTGNLLTMPTGAATPLQPITVAASTQYTFSFYARKGTIVNAYYGVYDLTHSAYIVGQTAYNSLLNSSTYTLISVTFTTPAGCTSINCYVQLDGAAVAGQTLHLWEAQLETGAVATPRINTAGATASRSAARVQMASSVLSATQGWGYTAFRAGRNTGVGVYWLWTDGTNDERIFVQHDGTQFSFYRIHAGVLAAASVAQALTVGSTYTLTWYWSATTLAISINGGAFVTQAATGIPTGLAGTMDLGTYAALSTGPESDASFYAMGFGTGTLAAADRTTINGWGTIVPTWAQLLALNSGAAAPTALWNGATGVYVTSDPLPAQPYVETNGGSATRNAGLLTAPYTIISGTAGWSVIRWRPSFASSNGGPNSFPRLFVLEDGAATNRLFAAALPLNGGLSIGRSDATGAGNSANPAATWNANTKRSDAFGWSAAVVAANPALAAWTTAANTKAPTGVNVLNIGSDSVVSGRELAGAVLWQAYGVGAYTAVDLTKGYWTSDTVPNLETINKDSPSAYCTAVLNGADGSIVTYQPTAITGTLSIAPYLTATITVAGSVPSIPPSITVPKAGMPILYYRPSGQGYVSLAGVADALSALLAPGVNATAYLTTTNQVSGASYQAAVQLSNGAAGAWAGVAGAGAFPATGPILASVIIYDQSGSSGTQFGAFEAVLLPQPIPSVTYKRGSSNRIVVTGATGYDGVLRTSANTLFYATIVDFYTGSSYLAQSQFLYDTPGGWHYDVPVFSGEPVVTITIDAYSVVGTGGSHYSQWIYRGYRG